MIKVRGYSDDLIAIDGDIAEEFTYQHTDTGPNNTAVGDLLAFSDGTVLRITLSSAGPWRITPVVKGTGDVAIVQAAEADEDGTDTATVTGATWVVHGIAVAKARP